MNEIQDAIQDAQYIGAMSSNVPRPTESFRFPKEETLIQFQNELKLKDSKWCRLSNILNQPLGYYLFKRYCYEASSSKKAWIMIQFIEDVQIYRMAQFQRSRYEKGIEIYHTYCKMNSKGPNKEKKKHEEVNGRMKRNPTTCQLSDLEEGTLQDQTNDHFLHFPKVFLISLMNYFQLCRKTSTERVLDSSTDRVLVRVQSIDSLPSPPSNSISSSINSNSTSNSNQEEKWSSRRLPPNVFDNAECFVLRKLELNEFPEFRKSRYFHQYLQFLYIQYQPLEAKQFNMYRVLGRGGFGLVHACSKNNTGKLYAVKVMHKKMIKEQDSVQLCLSERHILSLLNSPFVVCLAYAYQTMEDVCLVMDIKTGGDLTFHLHRMNFSQDQIRFWAAQILLGLQHIHEKEFVYRDLKPDNILLDENGNCSISDFGLTTKLNSKLSGKCGTRGYWAPEMLARDEHGKRMIYNQTVDWWSFGCLVYEMFYGKCPFRTSKAKALHPEKEKAYDIATLELNPDYDPTIFSPEAIELIKGLLCRNPRKRLGVNGADEVKKSPFFKEIDWVRLERQEIKSEYIPEKNINAEAQGSIGTFDVEKLKKLTLSQSDQDFFSKWNYISPEAFQGEIIEFLEWEVKQGPISIQKEASTCCNLL